jgi:hypothetical protein
LAVPARGWRHGADGAGGGTTTRGRARGRQGGRGHGGEAQEKARKAQGALEAARDAEAVERRALLRALVKRAHDCLCGWNHTDGCSWGYEEDRPNEWRCDAHSRWLKHYDTLINGGPYQPAVATIEDVEAVIAAVEVLKPKVKTAMFLLRSKLTP